MKKCLRCIVILLSVLGTNIFPALIHAKGLVFWSTDPKYPFQGNVLEDNDLKKIAIGMNKDQVHQILGGSVLSVPFFKKNRSYYVECFQHPVRTLEHDFTLRQITIHFDFHNQVEKFVWKDFLHDKQVFEAILPFEQEPEIEEEYSDDVAQELIEIDDE